VCLHWVFLITSVGFCLRGGGGPNWKLILLFIFELYSLSVPVEHGGVGQLLSVKSPRSSFLLVILWAFFSM